MPITGVTTIEQTIEVLNRAIKADPEAMTKLFTQRVPVNRALAQDETIQVLAGQGEAPSTMSLLGILNGIFGVDGHGWGAIAGVFEHDGSLVKFQDNGRR